MPKPTLTVYGATSFTARELLRYLDAHPDGDSFDLILSGRNGQKLETAAKGMKRQKQLVQCVLTDEDAVRDLVARSTVIVNLAGPFRDQHAEALIKECAATGTHYLDLCGERFFIGKFIIPKYDYQASTTGACIIPAAGFDSIPSDMTLYLALRTLQDSHPKATITSARSFFRVRGALSGGSLATLKSETEMPPEERERGEWVMTSMRGKTAPPRFIYTSHHPSLPRPLTGGFFFMYPFNRCVVRRSWFLSRLSSQTTGLPDKEPRHGDELVYDEAMQTNSRIMAFLVTLGLTIFGILVFGSKLARDLIFRFLREPGSGPSDKELHSGGLRLTSIAQTTEQGVSVMTTCKHDGDPGYIATNYMLVESALSLILPPPEGTSLPPLASKGGVLTPSTALGMVLVERLNRSGKVVWDSKIWDDRKPHRD